MAPESPPSSHLPPTERALLTLTREHWLVAVLAMTLTAVWVAWPALSGVVPLETLRLAISCALAGTGSLLALTVIEMGLAPWRFLQ